MKTNEIYPSKYLRAADLNGSRVVVVIEDVVMEDVGGKKSAVIYFKGHKKTLVLNKTNLLTCEEIAGDETDKWRGKSLVLYPTRVDFQGKRVDAIRIDRAPSEPAVDAGHGNNAEEKRDF